YTSDKAIDYLSSQAQKLENVATILKNPANVEKAVEDLVAKVHTLEKQIAHINAEKVQQLKHELVAKTEEIKGVSVIRALVSVGSAADLKDLSFELKKMANNTLIVLGAEFEGKPQLSVIMSDDLAESKKYHAGNLVKELAKEIQGGGGGQPFYATAGGKKSEGLAAAIEKVTSLV
ncbi:MAG: DHHA1 domain-containing protein, partial [Bacteroidia bacterium]